MQDRSVVFSEKLIRRAAAYREDAVSEIFEKTYTKVYCTVKALVQDENVTRDLVRDTYVTGMQGLRMLRDPAQLPVWIRMVAHSETIAWLARRSPTLFSRMLIDHTEVADFDDEYPRSLPQIEMEERVASALLMDLMRNLPEDQRVCVVLYYYERKTISEIAEELGISQDTVKSRLNYSKWKIKARVRELERNDVNLYGFKTRHAIPFMVFLFQKHEELQEQKEAPEQMLQGVMNELKAAGFDEAAADLDAEEEAAILRDREKQAKKKRRAAKKRKQRLGIATALIMVALIAAGITYLGVRAYNRRAQAAEAAAGSAETGTVEPGSTDGQDVEALSDGGADSAEAAGTAAASTSADEADAAENTETLPPSEMIVGTYAEKSHENWMEIAAAGADTYEVTFHSKTSKGKKFNKTYLASSDGSQLVVDSGTAAGTAATLQWANEYTVSVNETAFFDTEESVSIGGLYLNSSTPLRGGSGVDAYLGYWVCLDDNQVVLLMQMSAGNLRAVLTDRGEDKVDHTYVGVEVEDRVDGLPSKLRAHLSDDADETFWLYPDGTISYHSDGSPYNGKNFQQG